MGVIMGFWKNLFNTSAPKSEPVPASPALMPKMNLSESRLVSLDFSNDPADERVKAYVHKHVTDFRTAKSLDMRWTVRRLKDGNVGFFTGRTMMFDIGPLPLITGLLDRTGAASLVLQGSYIWDYKAGPFGAHVWVPREDLVASVELVPVP